MKKIFYSLIFLGLILILNGCYKVHHNFMVKGIWYIDGVEIDGGSVNQMGSILDNYEDGNGIYKVYMLENGLLRGEYYTYDTLSYFITGQWELLEHDLIYLKADQYIDGTFKIEVVNSKKVILSTEQNHVTFFNIGDVKSVIRLSRDEPGNYDDTKP